MRSVVSSQVHLRVLGIGFGVPGVFAQTALPALPFSADIYEHVSFLGDLHQQIDFAERKQSTPPSRFQNFLGNFLHARIYSL
jgi:hypothetical protein